MISTKCTLYAMCPEVQNYGRYKTAVDLLGEAQDCKLTWQVGSQTQSGQGQSTFCITTRKSKSIQVGILSTVNPYPSAGTSSNVLHRWTGQGTWGTLTSSFISSRVYVHSPLTLGHTQPFEINTLTCEPNK